ncbi:MAG: mannose-6-phosphate isomerase, class I [Propioniciclava sp.]|uniref:mannose-6-phosphate isomerase, class I n=1 Tax=Propioniciclava sp. TaxID=2038686 RepID=UPI0039E5C583
MDYLRGAVVNYPWGTFDAIHRLLGTEPDGEPVAELWLGAHPLTPSTIGDTTLDRHLAAHPDLLGQASVSEFGQQLPFLMKVLSARHPLSLQAHPDRVQAEEGFAAEEAAGVPRTAHHRTYKDNWPKPEILVALDEFHTLAGFRDPHRTALLFSALNAGPLVERLVAPLRGRGGEAALQEVFLDVLALPVDKRQVVDAVLAAAEARRDDEDEVGALARTALELNVTFPSDPGILAALLMNRVELQPGQAIYMHPGTMHAHLHGTGIEVMASSDNVLRGGLTNKHIAVDELVRVVDFSWGEPEILTGIETTPGVWDYPTFCHEFDVARLEVSEHAPVALPPAHNARIALVTRGEVALTNGTQSLPIKAGQSAFLPAEDAQVTATGDAQVFLASTGLG